MEKEPGDKNGEGIRMPKVLEAWQGGVEAEGAVLGAAEGNESDDDTGQAQGHEGHTKRAQELVLCRPGS